MTDLTEQEIDGDYVRGGVITINRADLPKVSAEYEASDFPGKDAPRVALAVLLAAGWNSADETVRSLRSVIVGYEKSISYDIAVNNLTARRNEVIAQFLPNTKTPPVWDAVLPVVRRMIDHIIELEDKDRG